MVYNSSSAEAVVADKERSLSDEEFEKIFAGEADPFENKISNESPIGKAILGKKVGDICDVPSPNGSYQVKIVKIA